MNVPGLDDVEDAIFLPTAFQISGLRAQREDSQNNRFKSISTNLGWTHLQIPRGA